MPNKTPTARANMMSLPRTNSQTATLLPRPKVIREFCSSSSSEIEMERPLQDARTAVKRTRCYIRQEHGALFVEKAFSLALGLHKVAVRGPHPCFSRGEINQPQLFSNS
jgi:hypothetical protein